jgi:hypothetical protein
MPIGPITPGSPVTVTPDASPSLYASVQAPTATMPILGAHLQALTLVLLNIQKVLDESKLDLIAGGTVLGPVDFAGIIDFQATGANRPQFQGGWRIVAGGAAITAGDLGLSNGSLSASNDLTVGDDALIAGELTVGDKIIVPVGAQIDVAAGAKLEVLSGLVVQRPAVTLTNGNHSVGKVSGSAIAPDGADTIIVPPGVFSADRELVVRSAGALASVRMRIYSNDNAYQLTLKQDDGTSFAIVKSTDAFGFWSWIEIEHNGSANGWFPVGGQKGF